MAAQPPTTLAHRVVWALSIFATKAVLRCSTTSTTVKNLEKLTSLVTSNRQRPLITVAPHQGVFDDPLIWGVFPLRLLLTRSLMRYSLGADEILFKNPARAYYFGDCCKSISVIRGNGVDQIGIDKALNVLNNNGWIHIYPEGRVNQADELLSPLRWGVGKLAAMSATSPLIVPIYFDGFQRIFPEKPLTGKWEVEGMMKMIYSRLPVRGPFQITFGDAVTFDEQREQVKQAREELYSRIGDSKQIDVGQNWQKYNSSPETRRVYSDITARIETILNSMKRQMKL